MSEANFPMQGGPPVTREIAEAVYELYSKLFSNDQSLDRIVERGGFGWAEVERTRKEARRKGLRI